MVRRKSLFRTRYPKEEPIIPRRRQRAMKEKDKKIRDVVVRNLLKQILLRVK